MRWEYDISPFSDRAFFLFRSETHFYDCPIRQFFSGLYLFCYIPDIVRRFWEGSYPLHYWTRAGRIHRRIASRTSLSNLDLVCRRLLKPRSLSLHDSNGWTFSLEISFASVNESNEGVANFQKKHRTPVADKMKQNECSRILDEFMKTRYRKYRRPGESDYRENGYNHWTKIWFLYPN